MLVAADGKRYWPTFGSAGLAGLAPVLRQQLVQTSLEAIEVRLVTARPLTPGEEARLRGHILSKLPAPFEIRFSYHDNLARSGGGKFEDFVSEVAAVP
jgi:phenylacetate-CoA ligase